MSKLPSYFISALFVLALANVQSQTNEPAKATYEGNVFRPVKVDATDARIAQVKVPNGFSISKFAENLGKPRMIVSAPNGDVYFSDRDAGTVTLLRDTNRDGKADILKVVARKNDLHGLALKDAHLYIAAIRELHVADVQTDGTLGPLKTIYNNLPDAGQHPNRTIKFGPDGKLYLSVGSTCNACDEKNLENATMLVVNTNGSGRSIYSKGLRNTIGFDWHPVTHTLFGMDHGIDWLGDEQPHEELNELKPGADYGWPYVYDNGEFNIAEEPPPGQSFAQYAETTVKPLQLYTPHAAPLGMIFYTGTQFPSNYRNDAYVTMRGSWNRSEPAGYKVVRIHFDVQGRPAGFEDFASSWLTNNNQAHFGRLTGIAQHADGSLLVADDSNGVIYRIAYTGK